MLRLSRLIGGGFLLFVVLVFVGRLLGLPLGNGIARVPLGPERPPIVVAVWYSTEKERWLSEAVERFQATLPNVNGQPIRIELVGLGSNQLVDRVVRQDWRGATPPTAISPASMLQISLLREAWAAQKSEPILLDGADTPQPLVLTPLVVVGWETRAQALWPNSPQAGAFWPTLHDALADSQGWQNHGGQAQWGLVKFGHTSPLTSNSGTQTLLLMAYGFENKTSGLSVQDVQNPEFQTWMREIEQAVPEFGDSTGTFMADMVQFGPGKYDFAAVYENSVLEQAPVAQSRWKQNLRVFYPPATLLSDHPFGILAGSWVTPEQQAAARQLRAFLLSTPTQTQALEQGFRPANAAVSIAADSPNNPFLGAQSIGVTTSFGQQAELPSTDVVRALLEIWRTQVGR